VSRSRSATRSPPTSWPDARALAWSLPSALPSITTGLDAALGATLAVDLLALAAIPTTDTAAMDGFAVAGLGPWTVVGRVLAGEMPPGDLADRECVEVATGAQLPVGVLAVLPSEQATRQGAVVTGVVDRGQHIRARAEDCSQGELLVPAGRVVTPAVLGLAASVGHDQLRVVRRPEVTVLVTGDELVEHGCPADGRVRDAIGPMLPGIIAAAGGSSPALARIGDDRLALDTALDSSASDVVVVSGGSAAGPADHVRRLLSARSAEMIVESVAVRPGQPQLLARLSDGRWVLGLPGNPYAALAAAVTLLVPLLTRLAGRPQPHQVIGRLAQAVEPHPSDTRLIAVRNGAGSGVEPVGHDRSGVLWGAALADFLAVIPPGSTTARVELLELSWGMGTSAST
jgi:molybdopterin molybdotransferase